jgi:hypothetical protein
VGSISKVRRSSNKLGFFNDIKTTTFTKKLKSNLIYGKLAADSYSRIFYLLVSYENGKDYNTESYNFNCYFALLRTLFRVITEEHRLFESMLLSRISQHRRKAITVAE